MSCRAPEGTPAGDPGGAEGTDGADRACGPMSGYSLAAGRRAACLPRAAAQASVMAARSSMTAPG